MFPDVPESTPEAPREANAFLGMFLRAKKAGRRRQETPESWSRFSLLQSTLTLCDGHRIDCSVLKSAPESPNATEFIIQQMQALSAQWIGGGHTGRRSDKKPPNLGQTLNFLSHI